MQKRSLLLPILLALAALATVATAAQEEPRRLVHPSLPNTEFHLYRSQQAASQLASEAFCSQRQLSSVTTREVRYFWKQLPYNISFYLGSKIEMTTDHPEIERGEVLCFPLRRISEAASTAAAASTSSNSDTRVLHRTAAGSNSCQASVTSVLCKRQLLRNNCTDQLMPLANHLATLELAQKQQQQQLQQEKGPMAGARPGAAAYMSPNGFVCLTESLLWTLTAGSGALILLLSAAAIILAACSVRLRRQLAYLTGSSGGSNGGNGFAGFGYRCLPQQASARRLLMEAVAAGVVKPTLPPSSRASGVALDTEDGGGFFL